MKLPLALQFHYSTDFDQEGNIGDRLAMQICKLTRGKSKPCVALYNSFNTIYLNLIDRCMTGRNGIYIYIFLYQKSVYIHRQIMRNIVEYVGKIFL